ncbi:hypothetical protein [Streptomyces sediminimaris]|uniref:hypothetical protein n=1 Tax=Streptomyces sediminimaris TaxID=3383721 RepID=UPI003999F694
MLLPEGFWMSFTFIVVAGLAATAVVAALIAALASGRTAAHPHESPHLAGAPRTPVVRSLHTKRRGPAQAPSRRAG